jgi:hypothetical protein
VTGRGVGESTAPPPASVAGQQSHVQAGQVAPAGQAGQAQAQPPPATPPSLGGLIRMQLPDGQGVVKQAMPSDTQPQASAVSALQDCRSACAEQGSAGWVQSHGAQALPAGQRGQLHTAGDVVEAGAEAAPLPVVDVPEGTVTVEVAAAPQLQLHGAQAAPAGQAGQAQVQVPVPVVPLPQVEPPEPPVPRVPGAQSQAHGGQASPGAQAGQSQVQVLPPPPPEPPVVEGGGGQSQATGGQAPSFGQARGCKQPHWPLLADDFSQQ